MGSFEDTLKSLQHRHWVQQLYREFDNVCYQHRIKLNRPSISIAENKSYWGLWEPRIRRITLNKKLVTNYGWDVVIEVLKHEMAHQWVHEVLGKSDSGHGQWFYAACDRLAVAQWARKATGDLNQSPGRSQATIPEKEAAILKRAEKLLALSQSDNEHEAFLAMEQVLKLNQQFNLDALRARFEINQDFIVIQHKLKIVPQHQTLIASILSAFFSVDTIFSTQYDPADRTSYKSLEILGSPEHLKVAEYVYYFLWNQLPTLWKVHKKASRSTSPNRKSFYLGLLTGFQEQLKNSFYSPVKSTDNKDRSVILQHRAELSLYLKKRHPRLQSRSYSCDLKDEQAFRDGKKQGRLLKLRPGLQHSSKKRVLIAPKN